MEIKKITVDNFKGIDHREWIPRHRVTALSGKNGAGKSSFLQALAAAYTGKFPPFPIRNGSTEALITAEFTSGDIVQWSISDKGIKAALNGKKTTKKSVLEWLEETAGTDLDSLKICSSKDTLEAMDAGKLAEYMTQSNLLPASFSADTIIGVCSPTPDAERVLRSILPPSPKSFGMEELDAAYDNVKAMRTEAKRALANAEASAEFCRTTPTPRAASVIEKEYATILALDAEQKAYAQSMDSYNAALKRRSDLIARRQKVDADILAAGTVTPVDPKELEHRRTQLADAKNAVSKLTASLMVHQNNIERLKSSKKAMSMDRCPLNDKLVCTSDKTAILADIDIGISECEAAIAQHQQDVATYTKRIESMSAKIKELEDQDKRFRALDALYAQRKTLSETIPPVPNMPKAPVIPADVDAKKAAIIAEQKEAHNWATSKKAEASLPDLIKQVAIAEELVALLAPKTGIREKILELAMQPIIDHCNARAAELRLPFEISIVAQNGVNLFKKIGTDTVPISAISTGEKACMLFLLMDAINAVANCRILMLDNMEQLDELSFANLIELFRMTPVHQAYDHILIAMVEHPELKSIVDAASDVDSISM